MSHPQSSISLEKSIVQESDYSTYLEEMKKYYSLKHKYTSHKDSVINKILRSDNSIDAKKKLFQKHKFKCVNCGQDGGSIFNENDKLLRATCGNVEKSCDLNLEVVKMTYIQIDKELESTNNLLITTKRSIILTKLDFLFNYLEEDKAVELFDKFKQELNVHQNKYNELFMLYKSIADNEEMRKLLADKQIEQYTLINEYKEYMDLFNTTTEINYLKDAVALYVTKIKELDKGIMELKYEHNHIEQAEDTIQLIQQKYNLKDLEIIMKPQ